jgi:hypothetical protein
MSIIDDVKRLERAGDENSRVTTKLKHAVDSVASKILENLGALRPGMRHAHDYEYVKIADRLFFGRHSKDLYFDYDGELDLENEEHYCLTSDSRYPYREVSLHFAKAVAKGLLQEVAVYIETANKQAEKISKTLPEEK